MDNVRDADVAIKLTVYPSQRHVWAGDVFDTNIAELLIDPPVSPRDGLPYIAPHVLVPRGTRRIADVDHVSRFVWLDTDGGWSPRLAARLRALGWWWRAWPSPSCREGRARVGILCTRDLAPWEHPLFCRWVDAQLGHVFDRTCMHSAQGYWYGIEPGGSWWVDGEDGEPIDLDRLAFDVDRSLPMRAPTPEEFSAYSVTWRMQRVEEIVSRWGDVQEGDRHHQLFRVAQTCRDWGLPMDQTGALTLAWNAEHCKPPKDEHQIIEAVLNDLDKYRRHPVGCALTLCVRVQHDHTDTLNRVTQILHERCENLYVRDSVLVELDNELVTRIIPIARLSEIVSHNVHTLTWDQGSTRRASRWKRTDLPPQFVNELWARGMWSLPSLRAVVPLPALRPNGTVCEQAGYDDATGLFVREALPERIADEPTRAQVDSALALVMELIEQFPMGQLGRSVILAYMLAAVGRPYLDGALPVLLLNATRAQSGKSLLANMIGILATGSTPASTQWSGDSNLMTRALHTAVLREPHFVLFDNVENGSCLRSAALDGAVTQQSVTQRRLYTHEDIVATFRPIVIATGNGVSLGGDLAWRSLALTLKPQQLDPTRRKDLKIKNFLQHVKRNAPTLTSALLVIWRGWIAAGRPEDSELEPWATFPAFMPLRHVLRWLGLSDPANARKEAHERDADEEIVDLLLPWISERQGDKGITASMLFKSLEPRSFAGANESTGEEQLHVWYALQARTQSEAKPNVVALGKILHQLRDRVTEHGVLRREGTAGRWRWCVERP